MCHETIVRLSIAISRLRRGGGGVHWFCFWFCVVTVVTAGPWYGMISSMASPPIDREIGFCTQPMLRMERDGELHECC